MDLIGSNFNTDHIQGSNEINAGIDVEAECTIEKEYDERAEELGRNLFASAIAADVELEQSRKRAKSIDLQFTANNPRR